LVLPIVTGAVAQKASAVPLGPVDHDPWSDEPVPSPRVATEVRAPAPQRTRAIGSAAVRRLRLSAPELIIDVLPGEGVVLGRDAPSPIRDHPAVSKYVSARHARVHVDAADPSIVYVSDLNSTNGTWLDDMRLQALVANVLRVGDVIRLTRDNPVFLEVLS
jgi:hypothetical protein